MDQPDDLRMIVLTIDIGGSHVKVLTSDRSEPRRADSGSSMGPEAMLAAVREMTADWQYDAVTIGYPGVVKGDQIMGEPRNLGPGWTTWEYRQAFACPVKLVNDAAMQAVGSYDGGVMLFLGLGTGLGSALIVRGEIQPLELAHLPYRHGRSYEDYLGDDGLHRLGKRKWTRHVWSVVELLRRGLLPDYVVLGGGNIRYLKDFPAQVHRGSNANAFTGGFRLWQSPYHDVSGGTAA